MKLRHYKAIGRVGWVIIAAWSSVLLAKTTALDLKKVKWALLTLDDDMGGIRVEEDRIIQWPHLGTSFATAPFNPSAKTAKEVFGAKNSIYSPSIRIQIPEQKRPLVLDMLLDMPKGPFGGQYLSLDGRDAQLFTVDPKTFALQSQNHIILDQAIPPRDPRGEPTIPEKNRMRERLSLSIKKIIGTPILAGMVEKPEFFQSSDKYLVWSNIPGFPLFTANCTTEDGLHCQLQRACDVDNIGPWKDVEWSGLAVSVKKKKLLVANRTGQSIEVFAGSTCWQVHHESTITLPKELGKIRNVYVDAADRLWISTQHIDDYRNASMYAWESADW